MEELNEPLEALRVCRKCKLEAHDEVGLALFKKDPRLVIGYATICLECNRLSDMIYHNKNRNKRIRNSNEYYYKNRDRLAKAMKVYREANKEAFQLYRDTHKEIKAINDRIWSKANKGKINAKTNKRRATKLNQTPVLSQAEIARIKDKYELSSYLTKLTGEQYHVDHIVPIIKGGLHHPLNLRVITAEDNLSKGTNIPELTEANVTLHAEYYGCTRYSVISL